MVVDYGRPDEINLAGIYPSASCLGPGDRCILWVQGCLLNCPGCITPEMQALEDRTWVKVNDLVDGIGRIVGIEGVTVVGGEPVLQAAALRALFQGLHEKYDIGTMLYTGYVLADLLDAQDDGIKGLLLHTDLMVDGPYIEAQDFSQKWRGSENQRFHFLTDRYGEWEWVKGKKERDVEIHVDEKGNYLALGIPPKGFYEMLP